MPRGHKKAYLPQKKKNFTGSAEYNYIITGCPGQRRVKLPASRTAASHSPVVTRKPTNASLAPSCHGHRLFRLHAVQDNSESSSTLSRTTVNQAPCCHGQRRVELLIVPDNGESSSALSLTAIKFKPFLNVRLHCTIFSFVQYWRNNILMLFFGPQEEISLFIWQFI